MEERQQRSTSIASTLDSIPADSLSTPSLGWLHARCRARLAAHDGDRVQAMQHYQRCVEIGDEEQSGQLPSSAIWQGGERAPFSGWKRVSIAERTALA